MQSLQELFYFLQQSDCFSSISGTQISVLQVLRLPCGFPNGFLECLWGLIWRHLFISGNWTAGKVSVFRVFLGRIFSVSLHIQSECGKIRTRKTPNTDTFRAVSSEPLTFKVFCYLGLFKNKKNKNFNFLIRISIYSNKQKNSRVYINSF